MSALFLWYPVSMVSCFYGILLLWYPMQQIRDFFCLFSVVCVYKGVAHIHMCIIFVHFTLRIVTV